MGWQTNMFLSLKVFRKNVNVLNNSNWFQYKVLINQTNQQSDVKASTPNESNFGSGQTGVRYSFRYTTASDPAWSEGGGPRNIKYKGPPMAAIFFMTSFNRDRGGAMAPLAPPLDPQLH